MNLLKTNRPTTPKGGCMSDKPKTPLTGEQKKLRAKELCKKLLFAPHAGGCVPSRCNCHVAAIIELTELLK